jgi:membrane-associated phospholipid phosphatase
MLLDSNSIGSRRFIIGWSLLLLAALAIDGPVAHAFSPLVPYVKRSVIAEELREGGHFVATLIIAVFIGVLHRDRWRAATPVIFSTAIPGLLRNVIALFAGRTRPVVHIAPLDWHPFSFDLSTFLHAHNRSFPSGHAAVAFGMALGLAYVLPRGRWLFILIAVLVGVERVAELAHYVSDVTASALLAVLVFPLAMRLHNFVWARIDANSGSSNLQLGQA